MNPSQKRVEGCTPFPSSVRVDDYLQLFCISNSVPRFALCRHRIPAVCCSFAIDLDRTRTLLIVKEKLVTLSCTILSQFWRQLERETSKAFVCHTSARRKGTSKGVVDGGDNEGFRGSKGVA